MPAEKKHVSDAQSNKDKAHDQPSHALAHDSLFSSKRNHVPAKANDNHEEKKHLPKVEIVDHKALQKTLFEKGHKPEERLEAAHKLYTANHRKLSQVDDKGKTRHFEIVEKPTENKTRIAVLEIEGKKARLCLDGTVDKNGKYELSKPKEAQKAMEVQAPRLEHSENNRGHHSRLRRASSDDHESTARPRQRNSETRNNRSSDDNSENFVRSRAPSGVSESNARQILDQAKNLPADKLTMLPNGMVYLRSKLAVDADGGPDWRNDPFGQAFTSLTHSDGSSLDATDINYFVLPMTDEYKKLGIKLGDMAFVRNIRTGKMVPAIFGDHGPKNKIGEGSQALCRALGLSGNPNSGGTDKKEIEFLIMPGSGSGKGNIAKSDSAMVACLNKLSGVTDGQKGNESPVAENIVASARALEGRKLWTDHATATNNGRLGCAISTSKVLERAGLDIKKELSAGALVAQLERRGWDKVPLSTAKPGDVIYGVKPGTNAMRGGGNAHVGIVDGRDDGKLMVYANVSKSGRWTHSTSTRAFSPNRFGEQVWAFTPPVA